MNSKEEIAVTQPLTRVNAEIVEIANGDMAAIEFSTADEDALEAESKTRVAWDSKLQYFFMVISYAVGLGNVWRFPYLTQKHGGGAFMIPYFIMLFVEGMPVLYLELAIGQRLRLGCVGVWNEVHPFLGGVGLASAVTSFMIAIYYNAIIMWCFFYLFHSFQSPLPWSDCPTYEKAPNVTAVVEECDISGPTSYYWYREALDISPGLGDSGGIKWKMMLCHFFAWIVIYCCIWKGIKSSGKVVYFTATFPYVVLAIFFVRGLTLEGATDGLAHMFTPKMDQLFTIECWLDAAAQIFFSFGLAFGGLIAFSSYNPMRNNVEKDTILVGLTNYFTAIFACTVIFAVIGFKATAMFNHCLDHNIELIGEVCQNSTFTEILCHGHNSSETITREIFKNDFNITSFQNLTTEPFRHCSLEDDLNKGVEGTGLAFIIFTQAINEFGPSAPFWSIVFFLMLLSLGLGSEFGTIEGVTTSLYDLNLFPWMKKKWLVSGILCVVCCSIGFIFVLGSGSYWVALFDTYAGSFTLTLIALAECLSVGWVFGVNRFGDEISYMIGHRPHILWKIAWKFVAPFLIASLLIGSLIIKFSKPITYDAYNKETTVMEPDAYPWFASVMCGVLVLCSILWIPGVALVRRVGLVNYDHAKRFAGDIKRATSSTAKFLGSQVSAKSVDSGHNSDEDPHVREPERPVEITFDDIVRERDSSRESKI